MAAARLLPRPLLRTALPSSASPQAFSRSLSQLPRVAAAHMAPVNGFVGAIGNTPLIRLNKLSDEVGANILGKAEFMEPGGSVKVGAAPLCCRSGQELKS